MSSLEPLPSTHDFEPTPRGFTAEGLAVQALPAEGALSLRLPRIASTEWRRRTGALVWPEATGERRSSNGVEIWCLSPVLWWLFTTPAALPPLAAMIAEALGDELHQAIDQTSALAGVELGGARAADLLAQGIALPLARLGKDHGVRTLLGTVPVLLCNEGAERWRLRFDAALGAHVSHWLWQAATVAGLDPAERRR